MLWDPFLYCINDSIQGNSETGNKVFVLPSKVAINTISHDLKLFGVISLLYKKLIRMSGENLKNF